MLHASELQYAAYRLCQQGVDNTQVDNTQVKTYKVITPMMMMLTEVALEQGVPCCMQVSCNMLPIGCVTRGLIIPKLTTLKWKHTR